MILIANIQRATAAHYGLPFSAMSEPDAVGSRVRGRARARQVAMYLSACLTAQGYKDIGRRFHRDHSTVIHAVGAITNLLRSDKRQRDSIRHIVRVVL